MALRVSLLSLPQELIDEFISYVRDTNDARNCALVSRSWTKPAQRALFRDIHIPSSESDVIFCPRLEETLRTSPRLLQYVRFLIYPRNRNDDKMDQYLERLCSLPFTHLQSVFVLHICPTTPASAAALQQLFSLSCIRRICMYCIFDTSTVLDQMMESFSPQLRHLQLSCASYSPPVRALQRRWQEPVSLESLKINHTKLLGQWLECEPCPLDCSRLTALSVRKELPAQHWPQMARMFQILESLDFTYERDRDVDLAQLPNLLNLRLKLEFTSSVNRDRSLSVALQMLATLTSSSHIQQIALAFLDGVFDQYCCQQLDVAIVNLSMLHLPVVMIEKEIANHEEQVLCFPHLTSKNLLFPADYDDWLQTKHCTL
ncbi:hypothetical protein R3P38DRAFT_3251144 [Favolaschia claudopus]|uniref:F-box domain-containing protein n=1 Tax=Favolaschia claudopus TaxID=2862362 RepID=A0AAW0EBM2_9AGAR